MTVSSYTMDTLYRNNIIDYVPYDLMGTPQAMSNNVTQSMPKSYNGPVAYGISQDYFTPVSQGSVALNALGMKVEDHEVNEVTNYRKSLKKGSENKLNALKNKKQLIKGLVAAGIVIGTAALLIFGKRKAPASSGTSECLLSKLNPFKWFKK